MRRQTSTSVQPRGSDRIEYRYRGRNFLYLVIEGSLRTILVWGSPNESDIDDLFAVLDATTHTEEPPFVSLIDASRFNNIDGPTFSRFCEGFSSRQPRYRSLIRRQALVRPEGVPGTMVAGFYNVLEPQFPVELFADSAKALVWLGFPRFVIEVFWREVAGDRAIVRQLREIIDADVSRSTLVGAARAMGLSERTLQRQLSEAGTHFQSELQSARVRAAQQRILAGEDKLTSIALDIGCCSLQHFSTLFRKTTGESPSAWRARHVA